METKERIALAALAVLRKYGVAGLSMRKVASEAGLSLGNLQYHFPSREQLLADVVEHHLQTCKAAMERGLAKQSQSDPLLAVLRVALTEPGVLKVARVFRELFALAESDRGVKRQLHNYYAEYVTSSVEQLQALSPCADRVLARNVAALLTTSIEGYYLMGASTDLSPEAMVTLLHTTAMQMLAGSADR